MYISGLAVLTSCYIMVSAMNDDQLDDLKQFVAATVSQSEQRLTNDLGGRIDGLETKVSSLDDKVSSLETKVSSLEAKVDSGFAGVGEAIEQIHLQADERTQQHEQRHAIVDQRLTKLEQRAA